MFIHIGEDHVIESKDVIAIVDSDLMDSSQIVEEMITNQTRNERVFDSPQADTKSIVITKQFIYFSPLSVYTLKKRANMTSALKNMDDYSEEFTE
ncbi:hypothetical protein N781_00165 [Pontibacillus halophilus JSM 076056 = DSM 19796]|uniref:DUF370 domain-containing protein n=1 Tax=Pontibacillus halophilus JSM 076056 = DSM 19796 TaxID=1385510 RepID=A0A0A5GNW8_9BACI|nr:DUF370 domain-containing protein [Pontibacillus halophilus]KGX93669.1 hypothetical protein N781_00165 [Pontibacillus halophilus JSM 076056 = DSM 19796]